MRTNQLGSSELYVSEIGLGCMSLGTDEGQAVKLIHEALDQGVNFLDTADLYDKGRNEELVGKAVQGRREDVIIATKVGNRRVEGQDGWVWDPSKDYIKSAVKDSLRRLGTDYIDLYQLHGGTLDDPVEETIEAFEELKREGWIRYYGISSIRPNVIREYVSKSNIVSVMSQYSILDRRPEEEVLDLLAENGISAIARGPVARGILSDRGQSKAEKGYLDYSKNELLDILKRLEEYGNGADLTHTAIRYALSHAAVACTIPGASSLEQLLHNIAAGTVEKLSPQDIQTIQAITRANQYEAHR
ncbi:aldo/keto reductase [Paenibacillus vortex V453]|uniref:Oxidoreductase n=2 Tax=Paenibacillus TaxID=44249 RepID=A0A163HFD9_9BACL|nr:MULTISPECIES: aldo/keto reductase [Paenibacillus]AWP25701.1 oxidoreductase [Paenibacillus sp. Cedars]EFU38379.1 aldo/keto reductase [Paenibacillus vortex V453]KZS45459.1 oxidoreductase [Paenibacillus glucanolyticus]MDH6673839.1 aryl-alcohol dehydrogenase-like predicted oxidoreductase [Paenibacillus sp. LBL]MPY19713.1 aldo/keto reductase [Paenibacillus glucanolyticus]